MLLVSFMDEEWNNMYMEKTPTGTFLLNMFIKIKSIAVSFLVQSVPLSSVIDTLIFYSKYKIMMLHKIHKIPGKKRRSCTFPITHQDRRQLIFCSLKSYCSHQKVELKPGALTWTFFLISARTIQLFILSQYNSVHLLGRLR